MNKITAVAAAVGLWLRNEPVILAAVLAGLGTVYASAQDGHLTTGVISGVVTAILGAVARQFVDGPATSAAKSAVIANSSPVATDEPTLV